MRDVENLQIENFILHILDPHGGQGLVLSDTLLPLGEDPALAEFITRHIQGSQQDATCKAARFRGTEAETPFGICRAMAGGEAAFLDGSQRLARRLYAILERDRRISAADLGVCFYRAANYPGQRFLALLKIDPSRVFRHTVRRVGGRVQVGFELEGAAFTGERLQKSAFMRSSPLEPRPTDYDLLLLDRQTGGDQPDGVARFFAQTFLDSQPAFDARQYTEHLYRGLASAQNNIRTRLSEAQNADLEERIHTAVCAERIDLDEWVDQLPLAPELKSEIDTSVRQQVPDRRFELDPAYSARLTQKVRYRGDAGLAVTVRTEDAERVIRSVTRVNEPGRRPFYRVTIETEEWKKV